MKAAVIIAAAGASRRMGEDKLLAGLCGKSVIRRTVEAFAPFADKLVVACSSENLERIRCALDGIRCVFCVGGARRCDSVKAALDKIDGVDTVLIHDGARPLVSQDIIKRCLQQTASLGSAVAGVKSKDTIKECDGERVLNTPEREKLWLVQTPQGFDYKKLCKAYENIPLNATDDACVYESAGNAVYMFEGDYKNIKLTTPEDMLAARAFLGREIKMRIGNGFDVHAFAKGRELILCGVKIPYELGLDGHSDADVAVHALMDALLGAAAMRDIGYYFPDTDPAYSGADSMKLLGRVADLIWQKGYRIGNADITVIAQAPRLSIYIEQMRLNIAHTLGISEECVCVKATTTEKLGFTGRREGIAAMAAVLLEG